MASDLQTPFDKAVAPEPGGTMDGGGTSGGFDLPDGRKETANMNLPGLLPTTVALEGAPAGQGGQVDWPPVASPGTIPTGETGSSS